MTARSPAPDKVSCQARRRAMTEKHTHVPGLRLLWADENASQAERARCLLAETFEVRVVRPRYRAPTTCC